MSANEPTPLAFERGRGWSWGQLEAELVGRLAAWAQHGPDAECEQYKPGRVWRWRDMVAKRYEGGIFERLHLRASAAARVARLALALPEGAAPLPRAVVELSNGCSLLVSEHVAGVSMLRAWREDGRCVRALPAFLAKVHAAGAFHGDLHPDNLLWSGERWVLLDLESLRHPLRALHRRSQILDQWARLHYRLKADPRVREAFGEYTRIARPGWDPERVWPEVLARVPALDAARGGAPLP